MASRVLGVEPLRHRVDRHAPPVRRRRLLDGGGDPARHRVGADVLVARRRVLVAARVHHGRVAVAAQRLERGSVVEAGLDDVLRARASGAALSFSSSSAPPSGETLAAPWHRPAEQEAAGEEQDACDGLKYFFLTFLG